MRWPSSVAGSSHRPVWTSEGWIIVLDGELSQRKRSGAASFAMGPAAASPAATARIESRWAWRERREAAFVEGDPRLKVALRATQQDDPDVEALAALDARQEPHDRVLEGVTRRFGHGPPPRRRVGAPSAAA